jgi:hypothetical protein
MWQAEQSGGPQMSPDELMEYNDLLDQQGRADGGMGYEKPTVQAADGFSFTPQKNPVTQAPQNLTSPGGYNIGKRFGVASAAVPRAIGGSAMPEPVSQKASQEKMPLFVPAKGGYTTAGNRISVVPPAFTPKPGPSIEDQARFKHFGEFSEAGDPASAKEARNAWIQEQYEKQGQQEEAARAEQNRLQYQQAFEPPSSMPHYIPGTYGDGGEVDFDPEGEGYDYEEATKHGVKPDERGKWPSRVPQTGQILKGRKHKTRHKTDAGEKEAGHHIFKGKDDKDYSQRSEELAMKDGGKVGKVMGEFKRGKLHSGSKSGPVVTNKDQAVAIAMSEAGKTKKADGGAMLGVKKAMYNAKKSMPSAAPAPAAAPQKKLHRFGGALKAAAPAVSSLRRLSGRAAVAKRMSAARPAPSPTPARPAPARPAPARPVPAKRVSAPVRKAAKKSIAPARKKSLSSAVSKGLRPGGSTMQHAFSKALGEYKKRTRRGGRKNRKRTMYGKRGGARYMADGKYVEPKKDIKFEPKVEHPVVDEIANKYKNKSKGKK